MDVYHKLREKLNTAPIGCPDRPEIYEILRLLFTPEEAALALHLSFSLKSVDDIAQKAGLSVDEATKLCEKMADKGIALSSSHDDRKAYMLLTIMPGIFEYPLAKREYLDIDFDRLRQLWLQYYDAMGHELAGSKTGLTRVIPVQKSIDSTANILPFEELSKFMDKAECIAVMDCACRVTRQECDNPIEVCFSSDSAAKHLVERKIARFVTKEEASRILNECEEAGLVHLANNASNRIMGLCNCCPCCCLALGAITRLKHAASHPCSNFYATINDEDCNACGICEDRCPTRAIKLDDVAVIDEDLCIGCGLCASACPTFAINLIRKADSIEPPVGAKELILKIAEEKGRLAAYLANLK